jgi:hypothetical protein
VGGLVPELLAIVHVGDVQFDHWQADGFDGIVQRDRGVRECARVEHRADGSAGLDRGAFDEYVLHPGVAEPCCYCPPCAGRPPR